MKEIKYDDLFSVEKELLSEAERAMEGAYNPYSNFFVGAAVLTKEGKIISGSNVENCAYGSVICAERAAILRANAMGYRIFDSIAIIARGLDFDTKEITGPCGSCRQVIFEFSQIADKDIKVILSTTNKDKIVISSINELLPLGFGPKDIGVDLSRFKN